MADGNEQSFKIIGPFNEQIHDSRYRFFSPLDGQDTFATFSMT